MPNTPNIADLEYLFYGGGAAERYNALRAFADAGVNVLDVLEVAQNGGGGGASSAVRADYVAPYSYMGTAPTGSSEEDEVWTVTRISTTSPVTVNVVVEVAWADRETADYGD
jgi:hypothetical protein